MRDIQDFSSIKIQLASPDKIRAWSYGEVKKAETINYRTLRPEKEGLFCERIFGTTKEWECYCGKFKSIRYKGVICDRCGVEVTHFKVRRERMGHIELAAPVSHIWYYRAVPSRMGLLLDMTVSSLRAVLYYEKYVVIDPGDTDLKKMDVLTEEEYADYQERYSGAFTAGMGAEAVKTLLESLDLKAMADELRAKMIEKGSKSDKHLLKRIEIVENFRASNNKPEWMILEVIPVIPPELRPMVQLDGGRFATSDLNDLYRRVINRNNRLRRLQQMNAPEIIIRNEKRMLQEAVDALFDNSKKKRVVKGASNRPLKSISDMLKGKQGRFRQNLLGKRVDYSGRSVITVGPDLKMWQCGLPVKMALELFKPFIMKRLVDKGVVYNIKKAKQLVEQETPEVFAVLDDVVREHPVLLNRAPTLHRLGIQAFEPVLVEGKAIRLNPLVCKAFNADFDGDQMAVHVPLTHPSQMECWTLMLSVRNLLDPANGKTIVYPSQDMVLGCNFLTRAKPKFKEKSRQAKGQGHYYSSYEEMLAAIDRGALDWEALIYARPTKLPVWEKVGVDIVGRSGKPLTKEDYIETTAGRFAFNEEMPKEIPFINYELKDKELRALIENTFETKDTWITVQLVDAIKATGYKYATLFGATIGINDIVVPPEKAEMLENASKEVEKIQKQYEDGVIAKQERYDNVINIWNKCNEELTKKVMESLEADQNGFNSIYMMANSGARGSRMQIRQLAGMRGLLSKPNQEIIELPVLANFKEGLSVIEFFISTNGARKGLTDTALKTSQAGYLTRRLVDIAQDVVVNEEDCGTINGIKYGAIKEGEEIVESLEDRIVGRYTSERVKHPITGEIIIDINEEITKEVIKKIEEAGVEQVAIRTVLTCEAKHGVCQKCYGRNLATNRHVNIGEAVGIIAAQSIGQPGTQLTMRTFHVGGAASTQTEDNRIYLKYRAYIEKIDDSPHVELPNGHWLFTRKGTATIRKVIGEHKLQEGDEVLIEDNKAIYKGSAIIRRNGEDIISSDNAYAKRIRDSLFLIGQEQRLDIRNGSELYFKKGDIVEAEKTIATFEPFSDPIIAEVGGTVVYGDVILGLTMQEVVDENTGNIEKHILELLPENKQPRIIITDSEGAEIGSYSLPAKAIINVDEGDHIEAGHTVAKTLKESAKASDITSGLPRVSELFEARKPKNLAVLAQVSGIVQFQLKSNIKGKRKLIIKDDFGREVSHLIPVSKRILVRDGDRVVAGEPLCDGSADPHEVLHIMGESYLHRYLMDEIQQVYRLQGITINDKHIGVIIRQMMRKVAVVQVGNTNFIYGQLVDKYRFHEENDRVIRDGGQPAVARPVFQGITRASLNIDSFLSAASFQETTRVLTNAAIAGATDSLRGLKENIIIGHPIPAGTGMKRYRNIKLFGEENQDLDTEMERILEQRRLEKPVETEGFVDLTYDYDDEEDELDDLSISEDFDDIDDEDDLDNEDDEGGDLVDVEELSETNESSDPEDEE